jgi:ADP-ribose pyrophosphatase YjhB (NUDIX family)
MDPLMPSALPPCDHTSVGILVHREGRLLLLERQRPPFGLAPPAGHVDARPSFEAAAISELFEEVGLTATAVSLVAEGRRNNPCRRPDGHWHYWRIYTAQTIGEAMPNRAEAKRLMWCSVEQLAELAARTNNFCAGKIGEADWISEPGLEPIWRDWLLELQYI